MREPRRPGYRHSRIVMQVVIQGLHPLKSEWYKKIFSINIYSRAGLIIDPLRLKRIIFYSDLDFKICFLTPDP